MNPVDEFTESAPAPSSDALVHCQFITGSAGTGKTYTIKSRIDAGEEGIILSASTGISAINMGEGVTTIHSLLRFYDEASLRDSYVLGRLTRRLEDLIRAGMRELVLDEISMFSGSALQIVYDALAEAAERVRDSRPMRFEPVRFTLLGDFLQLPPVGKDIPWAFECPAWERFTVERLTKVWRQADPAFLDALQAARRADGAECARLLLQAGVRFSPELQDGFAGATIMGRNDQVDRYNRVELQKVQGRQFLVRAQRWIAKGMQEPGEWTKNIPAEWPIKLGALVMILANDSQGTANNPAQWSYANGDLGIVREWYPEHKTWIVELQRNGAHVEIGKRVRSHVVTSLLPLTESLLQTAEAQQYLLGNDYSFEERHRMGLPYRTADRKKWVVGEVEYFPLRLAWATTLHKSQGLSLDSVQLDLRNVFTREPGMAYVGMSRVRTPGGLRIVGTPELLARRLRVHPKALSWV